MKYFSFISFLFLLGIFSFSSLKYEVTDINNNSESSFLSDIVSCYDDYFGTNQTKFIKCFTNAIKNDKDGFIKTLNSTVTYAVIKELFFPLFNISEELKQFVNILEESVINKTHLIDYIKEAIYYKDDKGLDLFDYANYFIDRKYEGKSNPEIINVISMIIRNEGVDKIINYFMFYYPNYIIDLISIVLINLRFQDFYYEILDYLGDYKVQIVTLLIDLFKNFNNTEVNIRRIAKFFKENKDSYPGLRKLLKSQMFNEFFQVVLKYDNEIVNTMKNILFEKDEVLDLFFDIISHTEIIDDFAEILINYGNITHMYYNVPSFLKRLSKYNSNYVTRILDSSIYFSKILYGEEFLGMFVNEVQDTIKRFFYELDVESFGISQECRDLFNHTIYDYNSAWNKLLFLYSKKFLFDSPRNRGDFMSYENCLQPTNDEETLDKIPYKIKPCFVIGIFDDPKNKAKYRDTTFFENYFYVKSLCLPYGYKNKEDLTENNAICNGTDYDNIFKFILNIFYNMSDSNVKTILLHDNNNNPSIKENILGILCLFILAIPIIVKLFLSISKCIIPKKNGKIKNINKLIIPDKKSKRKNIIDEKGQILTGKKELSKCQKILKNFFDFIKNGKELFNFDLNNTKFNNFNGIVYIKGLIGISIILTIFGLTFIIFINLPIKQYGTFSFYESFLSVFYPLIFIGYKYSPRVLFSCSGYTLIYKFLSFIEQEGGFYFFKFLYLQSYKYILLSIVLLLFRYTVVDVIYLFRQTKRPSWALFEHYITEEFNFIKNALTLLFIPEDFDNYEEKQNLIFYFFMPLNEIFFFVFGIILISLGYKYKIRLDFIIIGIIIFLILMKIIIFSSYWNTENRIISTTDYYLFHFGLQSLRPYLNLSSFLIGMYFGLINYSIQKGITSIYKDKNNNYKKLINLEESKTEEKEEKHNNNELNSDIETNSLNNSINSKGNRKYKIKGDENTNDINKSNNKTLEKYIANDKNNFGNDNKNKKELDEHIKRMPFLISPINFFNINRKNKDHCWYNFLIFLVVFILIILSYCRMIFCHNLSELNYKATNNEFITQISLINTISNTFLNYIYLLDTEIVVFLSQWIIFILFFKEYSVLRGFFNSIYWTFFVKSYYSFLLISAPIIICIFYDSETIIKANIYNVILYSMINLIYISIYVIIFYSIYELPLKNLFKYFLKGNDIIEEDDNDDDNEEEEEEENEIQEIINIEEDEEEIKSLKD